MEKSKAGTVGWGLLAGGVIAWDVFAPETLTSAFKRGMENEKTRPYVAGMLGVVALHLLDITPRKWDPIYWPGDHNPFHKSEQIK